MQKHIQRYSHAVATLAAFLFICTLCSYGENVPHPPPPPAIPESLLTVQLEALKTRNADLLKAELKDTAVETLTKQWTFLAVQKFASKEVIVDPKAAPILSEFIYNGAYYFAAEETPYGRLPYIIQDLDKALGKVIKQAQEENPKEPKVDEGVLGFIKSFICPLWPFCP